MFSDRFAFKLPAIIDFVGGGGKTALILRLVAEYGASMPIIYTTTTRIHPPAPKDGLSIITAEDSNLLKSLIRHAGRNCSNRIWKFVVTRSAIDQGLLKGVEPDFARSVERGIFPIVLNEADGARSMSLKMPREGEPVLMQDAEYLVPVIGLDCVNRPLGPQTLFRWESAASRHSLKEGEILTPELAASLLLHPEGVCKDWEPPTRIIPFINKVDTAVDDPLARRLAEALLGNGRFPVEQVVWGSVQQGRVNSLSAAAH